ncbi:polysaccharide biosynthesis tyrosine autokinase [Paucibacter sp. B51]|uniref:polysaccharide biosynthesis tyrosine autokinase n=1 Tax=Paucibacter sp. B51 TaxID=2993315 RepID=UPI0022EBC4A3|nr:polysaccharide biosynthesis tyrosine autokinase [Paucibacter sp. B51]
MSKETNAAGSEGTAVHDRSIGAIIAETRNLSADQVARVLAHQQQNGLRFGEAAIALGFANVDDVMFALAQQFHYPAVLGNDPAHPELVALNQPYSAQAEFIRALRSQVIMRVFREGQQPRQALAVVSANQGDGKSFVAANLSVSLAQLGGRTLLIDADMRGPRQHEIFGVSNDTGLSGILSGRSNGQLIQTVPSVPGLFLLPVGAMPPNPLELIERPAFGLLMRELVTKFDHVIVDTPAAEIGADALVVANRCGAAVPLARKNASRLGGFRDLVRSMQEAQVNLLGAIFNDHS